MPPAPGWSRASCWKMPKRPSTRRPAVPRPTSSTTCSSTVTTSWPQGAGTGLHRHGQVHLHRSALQYRQRLHDDGLEHSLWLSLIRDRLKILRNLLAEDGSLWVTRDDNEAHYFKVMCDEIFGRRNFVADVAWQKRTSLDNRLRLGAAYDHILVYTKTMGKHQSFNQLDITDSRVNYLKKNR